jgi:hypothetical protein
MEALCSSETLTDYLPTSLKGVTTQRINIDIFSAVGTSSHILLKAVFLPRRIHYGNSCSLISTVIRFTFQNSEDQVYEAIIFLVALCRYETWFRTLRGKHKYQEFESKVLRKVFGPEKEEVSEQFRMLHIRKNFVS